MRSSGDSLLSVVRVALTVLALGALSLGALGGCGSSTPSAAAEDRAAAPDPHELVANGATLLDVRTAAEYGAGHIDGAMLVPVAELGARMNEIPRDRPVVVYCHSGSRSARAASMLREAGYEVHDLGPMSAW